MDFKLKKTIFALMTIVLTFSFYSYDLFAKACNSPDGFKDLIVEIEGPEYVEVGTINEYTLNATTTLKDGSMKQIAGDGDYIWTYPSEFTLVAGTSDKNQTIQLVASTTVSKTIGDKTISCSIDNDEWSGDCDAELKITIIKPTINTPKNNTIGVTSQALNLTGSLGNNNLNNFIVWKQTGTQTTALGTGANLSTTISQSGEVTLSMYVGESAAKSYATTVGLFVYIANATTGKLEDIIPLSERLKWEMSENRFNNLIAGLIIKECKKLNNEFGDPRYTEQNDALLSNSKQRIVSIFSTAFDNAWGKDLVGRSITYKPTGKAFEEGFWNGLYSMIDVSVTIKADWKAVIKDADYKSITIPYTTGLHYIFPDGSGISGGGRNEWDPFDKEDPKPTLFFEYHKGF